MTTPNWNQLIEDHELAYFYADVCLGSPQSFTLDEKRQICENMSASTARVDIVMRADFETLTAHEKKRLLDMLGAPGTPERTWWEDLLLSLESMPDSPPLHA